jgi:rubrerythrin
MSEAKNVETSPATIGSVVERFVMWLHRRKLRKQALKFNKKHTFTNQFTTGKWMCPDCGTVHESNNWSCFTGSQYPKCCKYPDGDRCHGIYAT